MLKIINNLRPFFEDCYNLINLMGWQECFNKRIAKDVSPDEGVIKSLIQSSKSRLESEGLPPMESIIYVNTYLILW